MSQHYFIEILNNSGEVLTRKECATLPIRIGRAYHNDIILDDLHTAADHAIIELDNQGRAVIRNLESHNGIRCKGTRKESFVVDGNAIFHLGHTHLRVRSSDYVVAPEIIDHVNHRWEGWPLAVLALCIISLLAFSNTWLADIDNNKSTPYIMSICLWVGYSLTWAGIWALANRVFGGAAHFSRHLIILATALLALYVWSYVAIILAYGFSWPALFQFGTHAEIILSTVMIYYHLRRITPRKHKRLKIICTLLAVFGSGLVLMKNYQNSNQYGDDLYMGQILPPAVRMSRNYSLDEFNQSIANLKQTIDAEKEKTINEKKDK